MQAEFRLPIAPDHPAFAGHFPGAPILPGVVLLDAVVEAVMRSYGAANSTAVQAGGEPPGHADGAWNICQIGSAKFLSPVGPGETLTISCTSSAAGQTRFEVSSGNRRVATGTLVLPSLR